MYKDTPSKRDVSISCPIKAYQGMYAIVHTCAYVYIHIYLNPFYTYIHIYLNPFSIFSITEEILSTCFEI